MRLGTAKTIDRTIVLVATIGLVGKEYSTPMGWTKFTASHPNVVIALVVIAGVFGALAPVEQVALRNETPRRVSQLRSVLDNLGAFLKTARAANASQQLDDLGLHVWRVRRSLRHPKGFLERVGSYRLGLGQMNVEGFRPPKGEGIVGLCWKANLPIGCDVEALAKDLVDKESFDSRRRDDASSVMGFDWQEFQRVKHRGAVFAAPIRRGRKQRFAGCWSLDASNGYQELVAKGIESELNRMAAAFNSRDFVHLT